MKCTSLQHRTTIILALAVAGWNVNGSLARDEQPTPPEELADKLTQVVKFRGYNDPNMTLNDAVVAWRKVYDLPITVNERAFQDNKVFEVLETKIADPTPIPPMKARLSAVLKEILARISAPSGTTYLIRRASIEITTVAAVRAELGRADDELLLPLVHASFKEQPVKDVLQVLADRGDFSVLLDNRVQGKAKTLVTATFKNVPLDTAVRLLADMAELESVLVENALYVTTLEKAAALEKGQQKREGTQLGPR